MDSKAVLSLDRSLRIDQHIKRLAKLSLDLAGGGQHILYGSTDSGSG
jgi:hypothetical protein